MTYLIYGALDGENLTATIRDDLIVLTSRELAVSKVKSDYRDRVIATIPKADWLAIAEKATEIYRTGRAW